MKILHTLHWVQFAGTEKVCVDLCNEMSKDHEVYLLSSLEIASYLDSKVNLIDFDFERNRYNLLFLYHVANLLKHVNPDIIHCHNTKEIEIVKYAQLFLTKKIPIVATRHNPILKKKFSYADLGIAVSPETLEFTNAKKNILITNGVKYNPPSDLLFQESFNIIAVGRLAKVKGFDELIKALSKVNFDFKLRIIGEGELKEELQQLINSLDLKNKVELVGFVKNVNDYLYSSDLQVICSYEEGLSLALIEGIFYGKLIIASDIANHKSLLGSQSIFDISNESNITLLASKLNEVYANYPAFKELFNKVKSSKDQFSIEKMTASYLEAYQDLLANKYSS